MCRNHTLKMRFCTVSDREGTRIHPKTCDDLRQNQRGCVLLNSVQGRRSLHPDDVDLSLGTPVLTVASTLGLRFRDTASLVLLSTTTSMEHPTRCCLTYAARSTSAQLFYQSRQGPPHRSPHNPIYYFGFSESLIIFHRSSMIYDKAFKNGMCRDSVPVVSIRFSS